MRGVSLLLLAARVSASEPCEDDPAFVRRERVELARRRPSHPPAMFIRKVLRLITRLAPPAG